MDEGCEVQVLPPHDVNHLGQAIGVALPDWQPPEFLPAEAMTGRFCRLEPLRAEQHARDLFKANSLDVQGANWTWLPYGPFASFDLYQAWLQKMAEAKDPQFYAIIDRTSGAAVGVAAYMRIYPAHGIVEVGHLNFSPRMQQTPLSTEAMYLMMRQAFRRGYRRYEWKCNSLNKPSWRAAERLGFLFEGIFRQALILKGRNRDTAWFSVIDTEWPALESIFQQWLSVENFDAAGRQKVRLSDLVSMFRQD